MQLFRSITGLAILLAATVEAAPVASPVDTSVNEASPTVLFIKKRGSINDCGDSTFVNETSTGSPKVSDCLQIATNIAGGGTWTVNGDAAYQHQLVQYGTCKFGVQTAPGFGDGPIYYIGNQDIIDLIHSSIDNFQWNGLVGAKGIMNCETTPGEDGEDIEWGLY